MSKRGLTVLLVLAFLAGALIEIAIGYALRLFGRASTWSDIRAWATFAVLVAGFSVAAYELNLQRLQFAEQVNRSKQRDDLLDGQLRELQQRETSSARMQADAIDFDGWKASAVKIIGMPGTSVVQVPPVTMSVENKSQRPIRDVVCLLRQQNGTALATDRVGSMKGPSHDSPAYQRLINPARRGSEPLIRAGERYGYTFPNAIPDDSTVTSVARFTDDADLHWQVDQDMHLVRLDDRNDW